MTNTQLENQVAASSQATTRLVTGQEGEWRDDPNDKSYGYSVVLPENKQIWWDNLRPVTEAIASIDGAKIVFGHGDIFFVSLPGGNNPYFYRYDDISAVWQIFLLIISYENGWKSGTQLEEALRARADESKLKFSDLDCDSLRRFEAIHAQFKKTFPYASFSKDSYYVTFCLPSEYDPSPVFNSVSTGAAHKLPFTEDGLKLTEAIIKIASMARTRCSGASSFLKNEAEKSAEEREAARLSLMAKRFEESLSAWREKNVIKNERKVNNGVMITFALTPDNLFFDYNASELTLLNRIAEHIFETLESPSPKSITASDIRGWMRRDDFILPAEALEIEPPLDVTDQKKFSFKFPDDRRSRHNYTLSNYCRLARYLNTLVQQQGE